MKRKVVGNENPNSPRTSNPLDLNEEEIKRLRLKRLNLRLK
jgi:hypothetical protein